MTVGKDRHHSIGDIVRVEGKDKKAIAGANCYACPLKKRPAIIPPLRNNAKLIIVAEAPGEREEEEGDFLVGPTGRFMQRVLERHGILWGQVHRNNALLCRPTWKMGEPEWKKALECCAPRLEKDIAQVKSTKVILTLGKKSMNVVTGRRNLLDWAGAPLEGTGAFHGFRVISTVHPAFAMRKGHRAMLPVIAMHAQRAVLMAQKKLPVWRWPEIITEPGDRMVQALEGMLREKRRVAIDVETYGEDPRATLLALGIGHRELAVSMPWNEYTAGKHGGVDEIAAQPQGVRIAKLARSILASAEIPKTMQNGQHDILTLRAHDIEINGYAFDTLFAHAVAAPQLPHKLGFIAGIETHAPAWKAEYGSSSDLKGAEKFARQNPLALRTYNARDVVMTDVLTDVAEQRLDETHKGRIFMDEYMELGKLAMTMREHGVAVSEEKRLAHQVALRSRLYHSRGDIKKLTSTVGMEDFNPNSNPQLKKLYFEKLRVRPMRWSKETGEPSLDEEVLSQLLGDPRPLVAAISRSLLNYRLWQARLTKYVTKLPIDWDDKQLKKHGFATAHPIWKVTGALTRRWACDKPNLHNIPQPVIERLKSGEKRVKYPGLRDMYVARPGNKIVKADFDQLELKIEALFAGARKLLQWYDEGVDVHIKHAVMLFGGGHESFVPSSSERTKIKNFVYNWIYGGGAETIWQLLRVEVPDLSLRDVQKMIDWMNTTHPEVPRHHRALERQAAKTDYAEEPFTEWRRHFHGQVEETELYNFEVQSFAAKLKNDALLLLRDALNPKAGEKLLVDCHDEIVCEGPDVERLKAVLKECMETTQSYKGNEMRFTVSVASGPSWGECE